MEAISSRKNPLAVHLRKLGTSRDYRYDCGEYLCQGAKLYGEALKWNAPIVSVMWSGEMPEKPSGVNFQEATREVLDSVSPMDSVPDIIFSCRMPEDTGELTPGKYIVLESIQDPGNVGTVLRTAGAFGISGVILTGGSADPWNPKSVRASMGAVFRRRILYIPRSELVDRLQRAGIPLYATGLDGGAESLAEIKREPSAAIAIGNEGHGISAELFAQSCGRVTIPMEPGCESLNAATAASIIMWELYK